MTGTFMQSIALPWLVLQLTNSGTALGLVLALSYLPTLFLSPWGGVMVDSFSKRKLIFATQIAYLIQALLLGLMLVFGLTNLWYIYILSLFFGLISVLDGPARQSFLLEMVGKDELKNAITLFTGEVNLARVIGPAIAGITIATAGLTACFFLNALSYVAVILVLLLIDVRELQLMPLVAKSKGQIKEGFDYVLSTPILRDILIVLAIVGTITYEFTVSLPLIAQFTLNGNASTYAALTAALGIGGVVGGLLIATQKKSTLKMFVEATLLFGITVLITSFVPTYNLMLVALFAVGIFSVSFVTLGTTILQLESDPKMMGRVMALWSIAFLGSTAVGAPLIGWIAEVFGPRWGLAVGGIAAAVAGLFGLLALKDADRALKFAANRPNSSKNER